MFVCKADHYKKKQFLCKSLWWVFSMLTCWLIFLKKMFVVNTCFFINRLHFTYKLFLTVLFKYFRSSNWLLFGEERKRLHNIWKRWVSRYIFISFWMKIQYFKHNFKNKRFFYFHQLFTFAKLLPQGWDVWFNISIQRQHNIQYTIND